MGISGTTQAAAVTPNITGRRLITSDTSFTGYATANDTGGTYYFGYNGSSTPLAGSVIKAGTGLTDAGFIANAGSGLETTLGSFTGITAGSTVYLHVVWDSDDADTFSNVLTIEVVLPASVGEDFGSTITDQTISATRTTLTAPGGVIYYRTAVSTAPRCVIAYHDIESVWDFDDPGTHDTLDSTMPWGRSKNVAYGPRTVNVFDSPGTKTVSCTSYDGESRKTDTITITVNDPDTVFAGGDTLCVSQSSDFTGKPTDAGEYTSIAAALTAATGKTNARILLRRGETFTENVDFNISGGSGKRFHLGDFGTGTKPILDMSSSGNSAINLRSDASNVTEVAVYNIKILGEYDPTLVTHPAEPSGNGISLDGVGNNTHKTIWGVEMQELGKYGITCTNPFSPPQKNLYVGNTSILGWNNYGFYNPDAGVMGLCGVTIKQPTGTVNGRGKFSAPWRPDHGPLRMSRPDGVFIVSNVDFSSFNSWEASDTNRAFQDILRWNAGSAGDDQELVVDRMRGEGGRHQIYNETSAPSTQRPVYAILDRVIQIGSEHPVELFTIPLGGTTLRNVVGVIPNTPPGWVTGFRQFFRDGAGGIEGAGTKSRRSEVYSCAFIDLRSDANAVSRGGSQDRAFDIGGFAEISPSYVGNNIGYSPNMATGAASPSRTPLNTTARWTPLYDGERWEANPVDTSRAYGDEVTPSFAPLTGSSAIGTATGKVSLLDMDGNLRDGPGGVLEGLTRSTPSVGPYEPNLES